MFNNEIKFMDSFPVCNSMIKTNTINLVDKRCAFAFNSMANYTLNYFNSVNF